MNWSYHPRRSPSIATLRACSFRLGIIRLGIIALLLTTTAWLWAKDKVEATDDEGPPPVNPFECLGRYESATGNRTPGQMRIELKKKLDQLDEGDPSTVRAMKFCVIAKLKARLGHADATDWFEKSIAADPREPGYELFFGEYYAWNRGARAPVVEPAERHLMLALRKLKALEEEGNLHDYHDTVRRFTEKRLLILYQQDGQQLLPVRGQGGRKPSLWAPAVSARGEVLAAGDTRDFFFNNEMRVFSGEKQFAESPNRANRSLTARETWDLARAPLRLRTEGGLRLRIPALGAFDGSFQREHIDEGQIISFYEPTDEFADVRVDQVRAGYNRVFPLYPLFDLRVAGNYLYTERVGAREFEPEVEEKFHGFELNPSVSRFLGTSKLSLDGTLAYFDITDLPGGIPDQGLREKLIRSLELTYAIYAPLTTLVYSRGRLLPSRSPTRGLSFFAGAMDDNETYGTRRVTKQDLYAGLRFGAPRLWGIQGRGAYLRSFTTFVDQNDPAAPVFTDPTQTFEGIRANAAFTLRLIDSATRPLSTGRLLNMDMLNLVLPVQWDKSLTGTEDFENIRGGLQLWARIFGEKTWGTPLLLTAGYEAQAFYRISKVMHLWNLGLRLGWGDL